MKKMLISIFAIILAIGVNLCYAQEIISESGNFYYLNNKNKIKLCQKFGRKAEKNAKINKINNYTLIVIPYDDEGSQIDNSFIIKNDKLIFAFDSISQRNFFDSSWFDFEKFLKKNNIYNHNFMSGNFSSIAGLKINNEIAKIYIVYFYRKNINNDEFLCLIKFANIDLKKDNIIKDIYQIEGTTKNKIQYIKEKI